ncbi:exonuclease domain-containing protein [Taibaiella soli]|uniref:DNA polymerase III subunit epsilon n=1 Tax=Taibaiella soli TaxID=1649169 RepID=A0A2W2A9Q7_9BACT|nr:exonuclease domain-containing protein [Taibaiella soli]PZF72011.1 DNA polymerase III subunit epsilon [Taibaiella soli]
MLYAIVDIETTGSYALGNGITEIAIVIHDGERVLHVYETLVNPQRHIPLFIQSLTGISNEMVVNAPTFDEIAAQVYELLQNKIFVAHNVNFDYSFVKHHLSEAGYELNLRKLCTVRLARKIVPGLKHYNLGKLCHHLEINHNNHHRAGGDALATSDLFAYLVARDSEEVIASMLKGRNSEQYLPPNVPIEQLDSLPPSPGVYYFYDVRGKIIYVGKALNLKKRVKSHFSNNKAGKQKQDFLRDIYRISFKPCATELMAHILESVEIRKLWPLHNRSQKGYLPQFGLFAYEDQLGYMRLAIEKNKNHFKPLYTFNTIIEGHHWLRQMITEFELCPRLCNMAKSADCENGIDATGCTGTCGANIDPAFYNERVKDAVNWIQTHLPTFILLDQGLTAEEQSCILIRNGNIYGMGYIKEERLLNDLDKLQAELEPLQDNDYIRNLVYKHAAEYPEKCISFNLDARN